MRRRTGILIVDDDVDFRETLFDILEARGYRVATASDGAEAINWLTKMHFDIVLLDIHIPGMDGLQIYRRVKELRPKIRAIIITAYAEDKLVTEALKAGALEVINKPIDLSLLLSLIEGARRVPTIMVIDDDAAFCQTLRDVLAARGYKVFVAADGEQAILQARHANPGLIFIDIRLPHMNGLETYIALKQLLPKTATILMTGYRNEVRPLVEEALANGAYSCLYKPFDLSQAVELANDILRKPFSIRRTETSHDDAAYHSYR